MNFFIHPYVEVAGTKYPDEKVKRKLQVRAALNSRSMEAEARELLTKSVEEEIPSALEEDLGTAIRKRFAALGGVELKIPPRRSSRPIPKFD